MTPPPSWAMDGLAINGTPFQHFVHQGSGCAAWGIDTNTQPLFLKVGEGTATASLHRGIQFHQTVHHRAIVPRRDHHISTNKTAVLYPWVHGEALYQNKSSDFYDGNILYDFENQRVHLIDFDEFRPGPFQVQGRTLGSTRFMAPEEFADGAWVDERTTVFHLARTVRLLLGDRVGPALAQVAQRGQQPQKPHRHPTVQAFAQDWVDAGSP